MKERCETVEPWLHFGPCDYIRLSHIPSCHEVRVVKEQGGLDKCYEKPRR